MARKPENEKPKRKRSKIRTARKLFLEKHGRDAGKDDRPTIARWNRQLLNVEELLERVVERGQAKARKAAQASLLRDFDPLQAVRQCAFPNKRRRTKGFGAHLELLPELVQRELQLVKHRHRQDLIQRAHLCVVVCRKLFEFLTDRLSNEACDHTLRFTISWFHEHRRHAELWERRRPWASESHTIDHESLEAWFRKRKISCDCELMARQDWALGQLAKKMTCRFRDRERQYDDSQLILGQWIEEGSEESLGQLFDKLLYEASNTGVGIRSDDWRTRSGGSRHSGLYRANCHQCGKQFGARRVTARYCGATCRKAAQRDRDKMRNVTLRHSVLNREGETPLKKRRTS